MNDLYLLSTGMVIFASTKIIDGGYFYWITCWISPENLGGQKCQKVVLGFIERMTHQDGHTCFIENHTWTIPIGFL